MIWGTSQAAPSWRQRRVGQIGPVVAEVAAQKAGAGAQRYLLARPGEPVDAVIGNGSSKERCGGGEVGDWGRRILELESTEPALAAGTDSLCCAVIGQHRFGHDLVGE